MDKISRLFLNQVDILQKQLEHLLEKKPLDKNQIVPPKPPFQPITDLNHIDLLGVGLPMDSLARVSTVFSRLSNYFDSGLLFEKRQLSSQDSNQVSKNGAWKATAGFDQGDFFPLKGIEIEVPFQFPEMNLIEVRKVSSPNIFSHLESLKVIKSEKSQALIFKPHPDFIFMVTSSLGDPWLKVHVEKIQKEILMLLADQF